MRIGIDKMAFATTNDYLRVANQKLWEEIVTLLPQFSNLHFDWTKGHATNAGNNKVDELLNKTMDQL